VDGLLTLEIAEACYHSASSGSSVELESHDEDEEDLDNDFI
jgi:hypothetical protein